MTKFTSGDETDIALCIAIHHEFLRCDEAFKEFVSSAEAMILQGEDRHRAYKAYNSYARFVHHLYEFLLGAVARDLNDTEPLKRSSNSKHEMADKYVTGIVQRILTNKRNAILTGRAPAWENNINAYPELVPSEFAKAFRLVRNTASGHVRFQRSNLSLTDFYQRYHKFLYLLYANSIHMWGTISEGFPDLGEITAFSVMLKDNPPSL